YSWDFGDNSGSTEASPSHIFGDKGTYTVTLTVNSSEGCTANSSRVISVQSSPVANFTVTPASECSPATFQFTSTSSGGDAGISQYIWNFGDGNLITTPLGNPPSKTYWSAGSYTVSLTVRNGNGCTHSVTRPNVVKVHPPVNASFSAN